MKINHLIMLRLFLFDIIVFAELIVLYIKMPGKINTKYQLLESQNVL